MRKFYRLGGYAILSLLVAILAGCSDVAEIASLLVTTEEPTPVAVRMVPTPSVRFPPEVSTAARIRERGQLLVGIRYDLEPFSYVDAGGSIVGLEVDLARELARRWLGNPDAVLFRQVRSDTALRYLDEGIIDIALAGLLYTQEAEAEADFSPPYFMDGQALLTFPEVGVQQVTDLQGQRVGVVTWTGSQAALQAVEGVSVAYSTYDNFFQVIEALRVRQIDVYADMRHRLERARRLVAGTTIVGQYTWEPMAMAFRQDDPFFADLVTLTFQDMVADGTRDALYARWLPGSAPPLVRMWPGRAATPPLSASPPQRSTLDVRGRIAQRGAIAVGYFVDRWPYSANRADGVPTGFEVRLLERIAEQWLGSRQAVNFVPVTETVALDRLESGDVDMLVGNWLPSRELAPRADFSIPIYDDGASLFSLASAPVTTLDELGGRALGLVSGSAAEATFPTVAAGRAIPTMTYPDLETALGGLWGGEVAAILLERRPLLAVFYNQAGYFLADQRLTARPVVYLLPQGDSDFRDLVNLTLATLQANGTYGELYHIWFDDPIPRLDVPPGSPTIPLVIATPTPTP